MPSIKIVHILSRPDDEREFVSALSVQQLIQQGFSYVPRIMPPYTGRPPSENCATPEFISQTSGIIHGKIAEWTLSPGTYGCFASHKQVITEELTEDDYLLVCECDCTLRLPPALFANIIRRCCLIIDSRNIAALAIGSFMNPGGEEFEGMAMCQEISETHCILYNGKARQYFLDKFSTQPWDAYDIWLSETAGKDHKLAATIQRVTIQADGPSLVVGENWKHSDEWLAYALIKSRKLLS
jgi:hypothetical protein